MISCTRLRLWLLLVLLVVSQAAMLAHGVGHLDADAPADVCLVCLTGQNVDAAVPPAAALVIASTFAPLPVASGDTVAAANHLVPTAQARAPPRS